MHIQQVLSLQMVVIMVIMLMVLANKMVLMVVMEMYPLQHLEYQQVLLLVMWETVQQWQDQHQVQETLKELVLLVLAHLGDFE